MMATQLMACWISASAVLARYDSFRNLLEEKEPRTVRCRVNLCCGSITFWYGSGSEDPYVCMTNGSGSKFCACHFLKAHLLYIIFQKVIKKSRNSRNQGFLTIFSWKKIIDPDPYLWLTDPDPGGPKYTDPGPWSKLFSFSEYRRCRNLPYLLQNFKLSSTTNCGT